jgi:hypothetical protein
MPEALELEQFKLLPAQTAIAEVTKVDVSKATVRRWMTRGLRGVRLEGWFVAGRPITTAKNVARFVEQTSRAREI